MNRQTGILAVLVAVLLGALFYFFVWQPRSDEIDEIDEQVAAVEQEIAQLEQRVIELEEVRANAPEVEADVVAAESIVPRDVAMPALLRQMQLAADESGSELLSLTAARPTQLADAQPGLAATTLSVQVNGGYYQLVDFFRRIEDPTISPRGLVWDTLTVGGGESYPTLNTTASGTVYSLLPAAPEPAPEPTADGTEPAETDGTEPPGDEATPEEGAS